MIDFIKVEITDQDPNNWVHEYGLTITEKKPYNDNGENSSFESSENGLKFFISTTGRVAFEGSLHKYYNFIENNKAPNQNYNWEIEKGFNGNRFDFDRFNSTINHLNERFNIEPYQMVIHHIEYGLNISNPSIETNNFLNSCLFHFGNGSRIESKQNQKDLRVFEHSQYDIKIYNKAIQYGLNENCVRFEAKYRTMETLNRKGIRSVADLQKIENWELLFSDLLKKWEEILFIDYSINEKELSTKDLIRLQRYRLPHFWTSLKSNHRDRHKKRYFQIESNYSQMIKECFKTALINEYEILINCVSNETLSIPSDITQHKYRIISLHYGIAV